MVSWLSVCQSFIKAFNLTRCFCRLKEAQLSVKKITAEKKVETRKINPNSLVRQDSVQ